MPLKYPQALWISNYLRRVFLRNLDYHLLNIWVVKRVYCFNLLQNRTLAESLCWTGCLEFIFNDRSLLLSKNDMCVSKIIFRMNSYQLKCRWRCYEGFFPRQRKWVPYKKWQILALMPYCRMFFLIYPMIYLATCSKQ